MKMETPPHKITFFIPNLFTSLNMFCGFLSIIYSSNNEIYNACILILFGSCFDLVDGRIARLTNTQSSFGEQFDSMSDLITFGLAPAILAYDHFLYNFGKVGIACAFVFCLSGALRLTRFNVNYKKVKGNFFQGLPIPCAALALAGYVLWTKEFHIFLGYEAVIIPYIFLLSFLMISNIPFNSFKDSPFIKKYRKFILFILFISLLLLFSYEELFLGIFVNSYILLSLLSFLIKKKNKDFILDWEEESNEP